MDFTEIKVRGESITYGASELYRSKPDGIWLHFGSYDYNEALNIVHNLHAVFGVEVQLTGVDEYGDEVIEYYPEA